jgi:hypothetical protein
MESNAQEDDKRKAAKCIRDVEREMEAEVHSFY